MTRLFTAFSWFALCEYIIASANMGYHVTVFLDFPKEVVTIAPVALLGGIASEKDE